VPLGSGATRVGDESVKSSSSGSSLDTRSAGGAGIGVKSMAGSTSRSLVGVADARHMSKVVCLVFPGDEATEAPRDTGTNWLFLVRVFALFAGSCDGEGRTGELSRSTDSTMFSNGGVLGRSEAVPS
jgi:hypothetical protein